MSVDKKLVFAFVLLACSCNYAFSQKTDSLRQLIKQTKNTDTTYILALTELAYQLNFTNQDSSLYYAQQADSLSSKINFTKGRGRAIRVMGIYYWIKGNYTKSLELSQEALAFSLEVDDKNNIARCFANIGMAYRSQGNYEKAIEYQLNSLKVHEAMHNIEGVAITCNSIGLIFHAEGNLDKALEYFFKTLKILQDQAGQDNFIGAVEINIGVVYQERRQLVKALQYMQMAQVNLERSNDRRKLVLCYSNTAEIYLDLNEPNKVLPLLAKAAGIATEMQALDQLAKIKFNYAQYYNAINRPQLAYQYAIESQNLAKQTGKLEVWRDASKQRYIAANKLGKYRDALENHELFVSLRDSLNNEKVQKKTLAMEYAMKEEKMKMDQERKELQHIAEQERQKRVAISVGGIIFTLLGIGVYGLFRVWSNKARMEQTRIREKISRDIHDDMGSNLSTINILSNVAIGTLSKSTHSPKVMEMLNKISDMSHHVMESIDEIVWSIDPQHTFEQIVTRMRLLGAELENQNINFSFSLEGDPSKCNLSLDRKHDFYMIYKEAITNISKYAKCKNVYAELGLKKEKISLCIVDDGVGFNVDNMGNGKGLQNIKTRAQKLKGEIRILPEINKGTRIELELVV